MSNNADFQVSLKFIIKDKNQKVLILKTPKKSSLAGFYDFPGGRIKKKETDAPLLRTMKRELFEELGDKVSIEIRENPVAISRHWYSLKPENGKKYILWIFFEARFKKGKITLSDEHESYAWVKLTRSNCKKYFIKGSLEGIRDYLNKKSHSL